MDTQSYINTIEFETYKNGSEFHVFRKIEGPSSTTRTQVGTFYSKVDLDLAVQALAEFDAASGNRILIEGVEISS